MTSWAVGEAVAELVVVVEWVPVLMVVLDPAHLV